MRLIERLFNEKGIAIVWKDETVAERKAQACALNTPKQLRKSNDIMILIDIVHIVFS